MASSTTLEAQHFEEVVKLRQASRKQLGSRILGPAALGVVFAGIAILIPNMSVLGCALAAGPGPEDGFQGCLLQASDRWRIESGFAATQIIGLAAVVATISVAIVAASWRPERLALSVEMAVLLSLRTLNRASYLASSLSFTLVFLSAGDPLVPSAVLLLVSLATTLVSAAASQRRDLLATRLRLIDATKLKDSAKFKEDRFKGEEKHKKVVERPFSRRTYILFYAAPWMITTAAIGITLGIDALILRIPIFNDGLAWWQELLGVVLIPGLGALPVLLPALVSDIIVESAQDDTLPRWARLLAALGMAAFVMLYVRVWFLQFVAPTEKTSVKVVWVEIGIVPPLVLLLLLVLGRYSLGWGSALWARSWRNLQKARVRAEEQLREAESEYERIRKEVEEVENWQHRNGEPEKVGSENSQGTNSRGRSYWWRLKWGR